MHGAFFLLQSPHCKKKKMMMKIISKTLKRMIMKMIKIMPMTSDLNANNGTANGPFLSLFGYVKRKATL